MFSVAFRTYKFPLRLSRRESRELAYLNEQSRLLYNAALDERIKSYRRAKLLASMLGLVKFDKKILGKIDRSKLDEKRLKALEALLAWKAPDYYSQQNSMSQKAQTSECGEIVCDLPPQALRYVLKKVELAFKAFYKRCADPKVKAPGYPRFKSMNRWKTFGFREMSGVEFIPPKMGMEKGKRSLGHLRIGKKLYSIRMHREIPKDLFPDQSVQSHADEPKVIFTNCTVTNELGKWWVSLGVKQKRDVGPETDEMLHNLALDQVMGIDVGIHTHVATDDGLLLPKSNEGAKRQRKRAKLQRQIARCRRLAKRGTVSNAQKRRRRAYSRLCRATANARKTKSHQHSALLVKHALQRNVRVIAAEDLAIPNLTRSARGTIESPGKNVRQKAGLNRSNLDAAYRMLLDHVSYKAANAGLRFVEVDPRGTSIDCSSCGSKVPKPRGMRVHRCTHCGFVEDRDVNAALNIAYRGWMMFYREPIPIPA